jgi:hypothetical protein
MKSKGTGMSCRHCTSSNQNEFRAEMGVVHRQLKDLAKPPVLMWTDVLVCLDCGFAEFTLGEEEVRLLAGSDDVPQTSVAVDD